MLKIPDYNQEMFIFIVYMEMDKKDLPIELIQQAYSYIPSHNPLAGIQQMKRELRRYVIMNGQIFADYENDYNMGMEIEDLIEYDFPHYTPINHTSIDQFYEEKIKNFTETLPFTDEDRKAMDEWNNFMEKQYPTKPPKTKTKTKTLSKKTERNTKKTNFIRKNPKK